jgi:hypothetical protein
MYKCSCVVVPHHSYMVDKRIRMRIATLFNCPFAGMKMGRTRSRPEGKGDGQGRDWWRS